MAILKDQCSINLGSIYENSVAMELVAHNHRLCYYDNKHKGEVDFLIDDAANTSVLPIEVKSGRDYYIHSALNTFVNVPDYKIKEALVLSNERKIYKRNNILYSPIYNVMFL